MMNAGLELQTIIGTISLICSLTTLWLIRDMGRWNEYLLLIVSLTVCQSIYDISILMDLCEGNDDSACEETNLFLRITFGLAATFWTNVIGFVVLYTVYYVKTFRIWKNFILIATFISSISIAVAVVQIYVDQGIPLYYWSRILSILVNIVIYMILILILRWRKQSRQFEVNQSRDPVEALANRMKYYPIVQILSRAGAAWYEQSYGYSEYSSSSYSIPEQISLFLYVVTLPAAGIGYFIVFVSVSPGAYHHLCRKSCAALACAQWTVLCSHCCCYSLESSNSGSGTGSGVGGKSRSTLKEGDLGCGHWFRGVITFFITGQTRDEEQEEFNEDIVIGQSSFASSCKKSTRISALSVDSSVLANDDVSNTSSSRGPDDYITTITVQADSGGKVSNECDEDDADAAVDQVNASLLRSCNQMCEAELALEIDNLHPIRSQVAHSSSISGISSLTTTSVASTSELSFRNTPSIKSPATLYY